MGVINLFVVLVWNILKYILGLLLNWCSLKLIRYLGRWPFKRRSAVLTIGRHSAENQISRFVVFICIKLLLLVNVVTSETATWLIKERRLQNCYFINNKYQCWIFWCVVYASSLMCDDDLWSISTLQRLKNLWLGDQIKLYLSRIFDDRLIFLCPISVYLLHCIFICYLVKWD